MTELNLFLGHLNSIHINLSLTVEIEVDGHLPFLNMQITLKRDRKLVHEIYREKIHNDKHFW